MENLEQRKLNPNIHQPDRDSVDSLSLTQDKPQWASFRIQPKQLSRLETIRADMKILAINFEQFHVP